MKKVFAVASLLLGLAVLAPLAHGGGAGVEVGVAAPSFSLEDQDGKKVGLADHKGKIVVLEWINPECPFVVRHYKAGTMKTLAEKYADKGVVWLAINSTKHATNESNKKWVEAHGLKFPILNDSSGEVGHAYGAKTTPHMFVIDKDGKVAYMGGIDDDQSGKSEKKTNFVEKALEDLVAGKAVSTPTTKPYGCSVKFKT